MAYTAARPLLIAPRMSARLFQSLGVDAVEAELSDLDRAWLTRKLKPHGLKPKGGIAKMKKIVAGKQLWNYDNLEPAEKKLVL
jgi:hypothetical protein